MKLSAFLLPLALGFAGCASSDPGAASGTDATVALNASAPTLAEARRGFVTRLAPVRADKSPADVPPAGTLEMVRYLSPVGQLGAYLSPDPRDGQKHPAIVWITGGDNNSIGDVWSPNAPDNDQSASQFARAGVVTMYPAQRGGNDNPGRKEGFLGEADDILAARQYLAKLPYVDGERIYLGGHSTGGTMALLVAEQSESFRAVFALGAVDDVAGYGDDSGFLPFDTRDAREVEMRSPIHWLAGVKSPTYLIEGEGEQGNISSLRAMEAANSNPNIRFLGVEGGDHFSIIAAVNTVLAAKILADKGAKPAIALSEAELADAVKNAR